MSLGRPPSSALHGLVQQGPHLTDEARAVRPFVLEGTARALQSQSEAHVACLLC